MPPNRPAPGRHSGPRTAITVLALAVITSAAVWVWVLRGGPALTPERVQAMIASRELVGLPVAEAARRLGHRADESDGDTVMLDFDHVPNWKGGSVMLLVENGTVTQATWGPSVTGRSGDDK